MSTSDIGPGLSGGQGSGRPTSVRAWIKHHQVLLAASVLVAAVLAATVVAFVLSLSPAANVTPSGRSSSNGASRSPSSTPTPSPTPTETAPPPSPSAAPVAPPPPVAAGRQYPWHTGIVSTTFWVGEIFDPNASDGSQMLSTYDSQWMANYGGCDGNTSTGSCETEPRTSANGFFPTRMTPRENPFYLDLPFDDINDATALGMRQSVIPWAADAAYRGAGTNKNISLIKNRWVRITAHGQTCYGQIEDAGPGQYHDANYVFGSQDARPANRQFNGAGMDVSPALNGCLRFSELDGEKDIVSWQFVEAGDVPAGPWKRLVTTSGVR